MKANRILLFSVAANLVLLVIIGWSLITKPMRGSLDSEITSSIRDASGPEKVKESQLPTLSWSQIESLDYSEYISNLLAINCPCQTIRDILLADAAHRALSAGQMKILEQLLASRLSDTSAPAENSGNAGAISPVSGQIKSTSASNPQETGNGGRYNVPVSIPIAMMEPDPALKLNEQQQRALDKIYQDFVKAVGGESQNPNDPGYYHRWMSAQAQSDQRFKSMFGTQTFLKEKLRVVQQGVSKAGK